jgi:hypothetical protein
MTILRRALAPVATLLGAVLLTTTLTGPASARTVDDRCAGRAPIPAAALAHGVTGLGCSLVGRTVYAGRVAVVVPPEGVTVGADGIGTRGDVVGLRVSNTATGVRASVGGAPALRGTVGRAGSPGACADRTFHLEGHAWRTSLRYGINVGKVPSRLSKKTVVRQIQVANANMRHGRNTCGRARLGTPAAHYTGRTTQQPNIKAGATSITCGAFNTTNTVGFGHLPGNLLGWTCYWWGSNGHLSAADIMLDNGSRLVTSIPAGCTNKWDLEGTATHEFGHAYGMDHTGAGHANLTMDHSERPCSGYARTLGLGDWLGMRKMYGLR